METFKTKVFNFEENKDAWKFEGKLPCVLDFYADWCEPCKAIAPILEELAIEYDGKIDFYKIDTEAEQELSMMFNIRSIPTLLFIPIDGDPQLALGAMSKENFKEAFKEIMGID